MEEVWKDIKDYEGMYQISNLGRVKSLARKGRGYKTIKEKILNKTQVYLTKGYEMQRKSVHYLVAQTFIGSTEGLKVKHINGVKTDNRLVSLKIFPFVKDIKPKRPKKVYFVKFEKGWKIKISENGYITYSKTFKTKLDAQAYYAMSK